MMIAIYITGTPYIVIAEEEAEEEAEEAELDAVKPET
jgi:hypothetical protein